MKRWMLLIALPAAADAQVVEVQSGGFSFHQRVVIRVPRAPEPPRAPIVWREKSGPRCLPMETVNAAALTRAESVDLVLDDGQRLRARFNTDCPTLDFYAGLYLRGTGDGRLCARRDWVRARSGAACRIESFKRLIPRR
ncbi:hypothetical protein [Sphingomonas sp.]|uniref:hypothetical protein n=1 Tax=Sphingomonas sp. TaxID=28214 RepID=UPI0025EA9EAE|nr:hypothetical protein [Sphingomonas sp.]